VEKESNLEVAENLSAGIGVRDMPLHERYALALKAGRIIAAECDTDLRYKWIANPHADFDASLVLGKRDDELDDCEGVNRLIALKERVLSSGFPEKQEISFKRSEGDVVFDVNVDPIRRDGAIVGLATVAVDVTERVRAQSALRASHRRTTQFLACLGHELRNSIQPLANLLQLWRRDHSTLVDRLAWAQRCVDQVRRLADDCTSASGEFALKKARIDVAKLINEAVFSCTAAAAVKRSHEIIVKTPDDAVYLEADRARISQIVINLVLNALKYTPPGGRIEVELKPATGGVEISVRDSGVGVPPQHLETIFDAFNRGSAKPDDGTEGLGLGLTIVKSLVELHGGAIRAASEGLGKGSQFVVWLPAS
jgi:signal transduction histidine kinase